MYVFCDTVQLRPVNSDDAGFIIELRTNSELSAYLSATSSDVEAQVRWIESYKQRERDRRELYLIIENRNAERVGVVRMYDIEAETFTWGSWILGPAKSKTAAIESALSIYEIGFKHFGCQRAAFSVRRENEHTIAFHRRFGAEETSRDDADAFFEVTRLRFENEIRPKLDAFSVRIDVGSAA